MVSLCTEGSGWAWQAWPIEVSHVGVRQARGGEVRNRGVWQARCRGAWKRKAKHGKAGGARRGAFEWGMV